MSPSILFVVRIWQQRSRRGRTGFRASVRAVDAERVQLFTRATELARFFAEESRSMPASDAADRPAPDGRARPNEEENR
jgi:hypothetical protein